MDQVFNFMETYALWIGIAGIILLMGLIGFMFDSKRSRNNKNENQDELGEPDVVITSDTVNILGANIAADAVVPVQQVSEPQTENNTVVTDSLMQGNMPDLSTMASVAPTVNPTEAVESIPAIEATPTPVAETVVTPMVETPVVEPMVNQDLTAFAYTPPVEETAPLPVPEPTVNPSIDMPVMDTASTMPDLSAFAYTPPITESAPVVESIIEPNLPLEGPVVNPVPETLATINPNIDTPVMDVASPTPDVSAFAYTMPENSSPQPLSSASLNVSDQLNLETPDNVNRTPEL